MLCYTDDVNDRLSRFMFFFSHWRRSSPTQPLTTRIALRYDHISPFGGGAQLETNCAALSFFIVRIDTCPVENQRSGNCISALGQNGPQTSGSGLFFMKCEVCERWISITGRCRNCVPLRPMALHMIYLSDTVAYL